MKNQKGLKLIANFKNDVVVADMEEYNNIYNYERIVKYIKNLYKETGLTFKKQYKPRMIIGKYFGIQMVHIMASPIPLVIDGYDVVGVIIPKNKNNLIIQLYNPTQGEFFTSEKSIRKYLKNRDILKKEQMENFAEKICEKLNLELEYIRYVEVERKYVIKAYDEKHYTSKKILIGNLEEYLKTL